MRISPSFERAFSIFSLLFFTNGLSVFLPSIGMTLLRYSILMITLGLLAKRLHLTLCALKRSRVLALLIFLVIASLAWAAYPAQTFDNLRGEFIPMSAFGIYFGSRFTIKQQLRLIVVVLGIGALLSLFAVIAMPGVGIKLGGVHAGSWKGIYGHKNTFSAYMTLTLVAFFCLLSKNKNPQESLLARAGLLLSIAMIILSTSKSGLIIFIVALVSLSLYKKFIWKGKPTLLLLDLTVLTLGSIVTVIASNWAPLITSLGRDPTLSGRTLIWGGVIQKIMEQPILGYGQMGFWAPDATERVEIGLRLGRGYLPPHSHNGFLDMTLFVGFVGLSLFLVSLVKTYWHALKTAYKGSKPEDFWPLGLLSLLLLYNMTESLLTFLLNIFWVLYCATVISTNLYQRRSPEKQLSKHSLPRSLTLSKPNY
ncbi:Putative polysaccharide polymerase [Halomicronema hongdechloris C2206]|uniref:Polysaccharide polymerase n=2 Tax=Halomicronema hongdechloris TaxID=1209493 RepID=A0A1Z3HMM6_9CYAN|nr:Putative polysaccharide polymerase [Halomicronema hongdechloris C2206]